MTPKTLTITAKEGCEFCHGTGTVSDWVDYGMTSVPIESTCDCVIEQLPDDYDYDDGTYEIKPAPGAYPDEDAELERALTGEGER